MSAFEKFMALGDFIFDQGEDLETVGEAIQEHGIYKLDQNGIPKSYSVDSKVAFEALYRLVLHSGDEFAPEEYRLGADEREGFASIGGDDYGWPESAIPNMELIKPKRQRKLVSLNDLLFLDSSIPHGLLALQIESEGIYAWDKFEGFLQCGPDSTKAHDALTAISVNFHHQKTDLDPGYEAWYYENDPTYSYGDVPNSVAGLSR